MQASLRTRCGALCVSAAFVAVVDVAAMQPNNLVPYPAVTTTPADVPNLFAEPFTGMALDSQNRLFAVNTHGSTLVRVDSSGTVSFGTGLNPVSVAVVERLGEIKVAVVCAGTHAMLLHDAASGRIENVRRLDSEPADIVYDDERELAFVTCRGENTVLQFDPLSFGAAPVSYSIECGQRPGFLYLDRGDPGVADNRVLFAASVTGNNTTNMVPAGEDPNDGIVFDLTGNPGGELDDFDIYRIDPGSGTVEPAVTGVGSLIFDFARAPQPPHGLWVLSTDSLNADPARQSEPALRGNFVINQLVVVPGILPVGPVAAPPGVDLDDTQPGVSGPQYDACQAINQARALEFFEGGALVASPFQDRIYRIAADGSRSFTYYLQPGSQCYDVLDVGNGFFAALCLGTQNIEIFKWDQVWRVLSYPLGYDPTPEQIRRGRDVFLDGRISQDGRSSCASCHAGGGSDQLGWQLSSPPNDTKDVMVTQSLFGIADTFPHHWRGERDLADFQGAFQGLLGAPATAQPGSCEQPLSDQNMIDVIAFMQSLTAPASPYQHPTRQVDGDVVTPPIDGNDPLPAGDPVQGVIDFLTVPIPGEDNITCADCHHIKTGSDGNAFDVNGGAIPRSTTTEVAHLRQMQNKGRRMKVIGLPLAGGAMVPTDVNDNGFGFGHGGEFGTLRTFVEAFSLSPSATANIIAFLEQFDQGLSAAAHWVEWFDAPAAAAGPAVRDRIEDFLIDGADLDWSDLAVVGRTMISGSMQSMRWWFDPNAGANGEFVPETTAQPSITWGQMEADVAAGTTEAAFIGLPPGAGPRFAIDYDGDGVRNGDDSLPYEPTYGGPSALPALLSWKVDLETARLGKLHLEFSEEVTYSIDYRARAKGAGSPGPLRTATREDYVVRDAAHLQHAEPGFPDIGGQQSIVEFDAWITFTDRDGNQVSGFKLETAPGLPTFVSLPFFPVGDTQREPKLYHIQDISLVSANRLGSGVRVKLDVEVRMHRGAPDFDVPAVPQMVFFTLAHNQTPSGDFEQSQVGMAGVGSYTTPHATRFRVNSSGPPYPYYDETPGEPWIVSEFTGVFDPLRPGLTRVEFNIYNLNAGSVARLSAMGIYPNSGVPTLPPIYDATHLQEPFQMLLTEEHSQIDVIMP